MSSEVTPPVGPVELALDPNPHSDPIPRPPRVLVVGSYPPIPVPAAGATVDAVRRELDKGHEVRVLSPRPSAAHYSIPITGPLAARRLARAKALSGCERLVFCLEPGIPFAPPGRNGFARRLSSVATASLLSRVIRCFDHTTLVIAGEIGAPAKAISLMMDASSEVVEDRREGGPPPGVTVRGPKEVTQIDRGRRLAGKVKRRLVRAHGSRRVTSIATSTGSEHLPRRRFLALPPLVAALPFLILALRVIANHRDPVYSGDAALLELSVRSAAHGHQFLGPYSRFGFFHPGPAMFYLLAPFEWLTGYSSWALPLGIEIGNAVVAALLVVVVQAAYHKTPRLRGAIGSGAAGFAAALVTLLFILAIDIGLLQILWNPLQIVLPAALLFVCIGLVDGFGWPAALGLAAATYITQTDLSTVPVTVAAVLCGAVFALWSVVVKRRSDRERSATRESSHRGTRWSTLGPVALTAAALLLWIPPLVEEIRDRPGNMSRLVSFFGHNHGLTHPGWSASVSYVGRELAVFPARIPWSGSLTPQTVGEHRYAAAFAIFLLAALLLAILGWRGGNGAHLRLAVISGVGALVAVYSVRSVDGQVYWYLTAWMSALVVPLLLGWVLLLAELLPRLGMAVVVGGVAAVAILAVMASSTTAVEDNRAFPNEPRYRAATLTAWRMLKPFLRADRNGLVIVSGDSDLVPTLAGLVLKMSRNGISVKVTFDLAPPFDLGYRSPPGTKPEYLLTTTGVPNGYREIATAASAQPGTTTMTLSKLIASR